MEWAPQRVGPIGWGPINDLVKEELKKLKLDVEMGNVLIKGFRGYSMTCRVLQSGHRSCDRSRKVNKGRIGAVLVLESGCLRVDFSDVRLGGCHFKSILINSCSQGVTQHP